MALRGRWFYGGIGFSEICLDPRPDRSAIGERHRHSYYDIELNLTNGKKLTLGRSLRNNHEVEWLVHEMTRLAGGQKKMMAGTE